MRQFSFAQRSGELTIPAQIHREADGFDKTKASILDAELNIRDEQGAVSDFVKFFTDAGVTEAEANDRGLLARAKGRAGWRIARQGGDEVIAAHRAGKLSDKAAKVIATTAPNDSALQAVGVKAFMEGKGVDTAANMMRAVRQLAGERSQGGAQGDIFGFDDSAMREAADMARRATGEQRQIREQIAAVQGAAKRPEQAAKMGVDVRDPDGILKRVDELKAEAARWDNWHTQPDLVAKVRGLPAPEPAAVEPEPEAPVMPEGPGLFGDAPAAAPSFDLTAEQDGVVPPAPAPMLRPDERPENFALTPEAPPADANVSSTAQGDMLGGQVQAIQNQRPTPAAVPPSAGGGLFAAPAQPSAVDRAQGDRGQPAEQAAPQESGLFGPIFSGLKNQPEAAITKLMTEKKGEVPDAFLHPELGPIAFVYGDEKMGLRHIQAKRGPEWIEKIPSLLREGEVVADPSGLPRTYLVRKSDNPASVAVIRLDWSGQKKTWLVTAYPDDFAKFVDQEKSGASQKRTGRADDGGRGFSAPPDDLQTTPAAESSPPDAPSSRLDAAASALDAEIEKAAAELAALFKKSQGRLNSGVDPELLAAGAKLGALYVAKGVVKFAQWAKAIVEQMRALGVDADVVVPALKEFYGAVQARVDDKTFEAMDDMRTVRSFDLSTLMAAREPTIEPLDIEAPRPDVA